MNPFSQPKNYDEMLLKIMTYTFTVSLVFVALVAHFWPRLWNLLHPYWLTFDIDVLNLHRIPPAYIVAALFISWFSRVFRLHDRVSNFFGIRERFDLNEILVSMANSVGISIDLDKRDRLLQHRHEVMRKVFYRYASSTNPVIDQHLIWTALDKWSWFWILIEATVVAFVAFLTLLIIGVTTVAAPIGLAVIAGILVATQVNRTCAGAAHAQIRAIVDDPTRVAQIGAVFNAL